MIRLSSGRMLPSSFASASRRDFARRWDHVESLR
jgi:hypothetical protein